MKFRACDEEEDEDEGGYTRGHAEVLSSGEDEYFAAFLCLPNPESPSGWAYHPVKRRPSSPTSAPGRRIGF